MARPLRRRWLAGGVADVTLNTGVAAHTHLARDITDLTAANPGVVTSVNARIGDVVLAASDVGAQPVDSDLTAIAALATTSYGRALLVLADAAAGRTAFGLGTAATSASTDFQPVDSDLTAIAALTTTSFGRSILTQADSAALRTLAGLGTAGGLPRPAAPDRRPRARASTRSRRSRRVAICSTGTRRRTNGSRKARRDSSSKSVRAIRRGRRSPKPTSPASGPILARRSRGWRTRQSRPPRTARSSMTRCSLTRRRARSTSRYRLHRPTRLE